MIFMMKKHTLIQLLPIMLGFFVMGFCDIVGVASDYVQRSFHWSDTLTGFVPSMVFIWFLFLSIPAGNLMNRIGRKTTVLLSLLVTVVGMILPLICYDTLTCMLAFALLGIGNAILQVSLNPLLGNVITDRQYLTSCLTLGQVVKAVSSLCGPEFVIFVVSQWGEDHWYLCFPLLGLVTVVTAVWLWVTPIQRDESSGNGLAFSDTFHLLGNSKMLMLFFGILFIVGLDVSVNFISSKLMMGRFFWTVEQAKFAPQDYFLFRTIGALTGSYLLTRVSEIKYFRVCIVLCLAAVVTLLFKSSPTFTLILIGIIGFTASSIFSIIYSVAIQERPAQANEISGLMMTAISGGAIVTAALGFCIGHFGLAGGVAVILVCATYLTFCAFSVSHKNSKSSII